MMNFLRAAAMALLMLPATGSAQDYQTGLEAAQRGDYSKALQEWQPLAEQGVAAAQYSLGFLYYEGQGVVQDYAEAARWYRLAAEQGIPVAQFNLGLMYDMGYGVSQNDALAIHWYRMAAEQGNTGAQFNLAVIYSFAKGALQDNVTSHMWFNIAAANGHVVAPDSRSMVEARMNREQISEAQRRARSCMETGYQDCD